MLRLLALSFISFLIVLPQDAPTDDRITQAETAYYTGDYATAIQTYGALLQDGIESSALYFNLGNAYFEAGQLGDALVAYQRAQLQHPRDTDINANISRVRALRADFQGDEQFIIDKFASSTYSVMTRIELGIVTAIGWTLWFIAATLWLWRQTWRRYLSIPLVVGGVVMLIGVTLFFSREFSDTYRPRAIVTELQASVYSGPSEDYLNIYQLYSAAEIRILEIQREWVRFILPDGQQGWILRSAVTCI